MPPCGAALMMMTVCDYLSGNLPDRDELPRSAQRLRVRQLLEQARFPELAERLDEPVIQLGASARRAIAILRTAAARPAMLVLDEPLAGVDAAARPPLLELLRLQASQRAVLILAQDALPLLPLAPRLGSLADLVSPSSTSLPDT